MPSALNFQTFLCSLKDTECPREAVPINLPISYLCYPHQRCALILGEITLQLSRGANIISLLQMYCCSVAKSRQQLQPWTAAYQGSLCFCCPRVGSNSYIEAEMMSSNYLILSHPFSSTFYFSQHQHHTIVSSLYQVNKMSALASASVQL